MDKNLYGILPQSAQDVSVLSLSLFFSDISFPFLSISPLSKMYNDPANTTSGSWAPPSVTPHPIPFGGSVRGPEPDRTPAIYPSHTFPGGRTTSSTPESAWNSPNLNSSPPPYTPTIPISNPHNAWNANPSLLTQPYTPVNTSAPTTPTPYLGSDGHYTPSNHWGIQPALPPHGGNIYGPAMTPQPNAQSSINTHPSNIPTSAPSTAPTTASAASAAPAAAAPAARSASNKPGRTKHMTAAQPLPLHWQRPVVRVRPSVRRMWLRIGQAVVSFGSFAFQIGATPVSNIITFDGRAVHASVNISKNFIART